MKFERKYFEENLADKKIYDAKMRLSKNLGNDFEFNNSKDFEENIKGADLTFISLDQEMKMKLNMDLEEETKISFIRLKDSKTEETIGNFQNAFVSQNENGIIEMDEFTKYLPSFLEELVNGSYLDNLKLQKNLFNSHDFKYGQRVGISGENSDIKDQSLDLNKVALDFFMKDLDMDSDIQEDEDKQKRYNFMERVVKAYGIINLLEIMSTENKISELDEDDIETYKILDNFLKYLKSLNMDNMYLDYYIRDNDLVTCVIITDEFQTKCIRISRDFKDVFNGTYTKYPEVTDMFSSRTNQEELMDKLNDGTLNIATEYRLIKEGKSVLINLETDDKEDELSTFFSEEDVSLYFSDATFTRKVYNSLKTINFIKTFSEFDQEILEAPSKILDYLPEIKIPDIM